MDWIEVIASNDRLGEDRNHSKTSEKNKTGLTKISNTETLHVKQRQWSTKVA